MASRGWYKPASEKHGSHYWRTKQLLPAELLRGCQLAHLGHCQGPLERAHINGDYRDTRIENLAVLCTSHHRLLDKGRLTLQSTTMPVFYESAGGGKRRYGRIRTGKTCRRFLVLGLPRGESQRCGLPKGHTGPCGQREEPTR